MWPRFPCRAWELLPVRHVLWPELRINSERSPGWRLALAGGKGNPDALADIAIADSFSLGFVLRRHVDQHLAPLAACARAARAVFRRHGIARK